MTILPKKKHPDGKKNDTNSSNDLRHSRSRNNCARTSGERANRSSDEINESSVYRGGNLELRSSSDSSSNGKRRYRNSTNDYRRRDEAGYNSEDEYDVCNGDDQPTEEVSQATVYTVAKPSQASKVANINFGFVRSSCVYYAMLFREDFVLELMVFVFLLRLRNISKRF